MNRHARLFSLSVLALSINTAIAAETELVSVFNSQVSDQSVNDVDVNLDGRYVIFESKSDKLAGPTNGYNQIFLRDMVTGNVSLVSRNSLGVAANNNVRKASISSDGKRIVFETNADNMGSGNTRNNVYLRDLVNNTTTLVSSSKTGTPGDGASRNPRISGDGNFVVFDSTSTDLVDGDSNLKTDIFIKEVQSGNISRVSVDSTGQQQFANSLFPDVSNDGRFIAFISLSANIAPDNIDNNNRHDVFVHDRLTGHTELVSKNSNGAIGDNISTLPRISGSGRYVAFMSTSTNLDTMKDDTNGKTDIYLHDRTEGTTIRVSKRNDSTQTTELSFNPRISDNGRFVSFVNPDGNIVSGDNNSAKDLFVFDRVNDSIFAASINNSGQFGNGSVSTNSALSGDGSSAVFISNAANFDGSNRDNDNLNDAYLRIVSVPNSKPVAQAGSSSAIQSCNDGVASFTLNANGSYDLDGDNLSYLWSGPFGELAGSSVTVQLEYGVHTVSLSVTDSTGSTAEDILILEVTDTTPPSVFAGNDATIEATSQSGASHTLSYNVTDECTAPGVGISPQLSVYPLGTTSIMVTGSDEAGNTASDTVNLTVIDSTAPVVFPPADIQVEASSLLTGVEPGQATATDIFPVISISHSGSGSYSLGKTTITWKAVDANNNTGIATQEINVVDTTLPTITAPDDIIVEATSDKMQVELGQATVHDLFLENVTHNAPLEGFGLGLTEVTWTATDTSGNNASDTQTVTLQDTIAPVISMISNITLEATTREGSEYQPGYIVSDSCNCGTLDISLTPELVFYPLGETLLTVKATDLSGNFSSKDLLISVVDTTAPVLNIPENRVIEAQSEMTIVDIGQATATDIFPVSLRNNAPASFALGKTTVEWTATDDNKNSSKGMQIIEVRDTTAPVVQTLNDITVEATGKLTPVTIKQPVASDIFPLTYTNNAPASGFPLGDTTITWTITDSSDNSTTASQIIHIVDTTPPVLNVGEDVTLEAISRDGSPYSFNYTVTDSCDCGPIDVTAKPTYSFYPLGITAVTLTATDISGNSTSDIMSIKVVDTTAPQLFIPANVTMEATGEMTAVNIGMASAHDIFDVTLENNAPSQYAVGQTAVNWKATDSNNNVSSAIQLITITDTQPPEFELEVIREKLWPPRFQMIHAASVKSVSDIADSNPVVDISISSNGSDQEGKGRFARGKDWKIEKHEDEWHIFLRAEKLFKLREDRVYTINVTVSDTSGNTSKQAAEVTVPRHGKHSHKHGKHEHKKKDHKHSKKDHDRRHSSHSHKNKDKSDGTSRHDRG